MAVAADDKPCALYRYYDARGRLLYVGISYHVIIRASQHRDAPWYSEYVTSRVQHFPTRAEAAAAEINAIQRERPIHNKMHAIKKKPGRSKGPTKAQGQNRQRKGPYIQGTPTSVPSGHPWGFYHAESVYRLMRIAPDALEAVAETVAAYHEYRRSTGGCSAGFYESPRPAGRTWGYYVDRCAGPRRRPDDEHLTREDRDWLHGKAWATVQRLIGENAPFQCDCGDCKSWRDLEDRADRLMAQGLCPLCEQARHGCICLEGA